MSNNQNTPSGQQILDAIRNKSKLPPSNMHDKLRDMLKNGGKVKVNLPTGQTATITEREIDPLTDERSLEHPRTVREALEIAFQKYEETDDDGPSIYENIVSGEQVTASDKNKELADKCLTYFGHYLFEKKLEDPESLSSWENEVAKLVSTPNRSLKRMWISLVVTLPRFFTINVTKLKLMELKESIPEGAYIDFDTKITKGGKEEPLISKLKFIETFVERNQNKNHQTYIFSSNYSNSYIIKYSIDRDDIDKVKFLDYIIANHKSSDGSYPCRIIGESKKFIGNFNCLDIQRIEFI